jgi:hypothetical protein
VTSNTYCDWVIDHIFLFVPAQDYVGKFLMTFRDYPQRQKAASFNLDEVLQKLKEHGGGKWPEDRILIPSRPQMSGDGMEKRRTNPT